jgi:hypothetical protein
MVPFRQASFAGGEIAPSLSGRSDVARYGVSLRTCRNFLITPQGGALNRPGTTFVAEVKDSTKRVRLVPFFYTDTDVYFLEFGNLYIRVFKNGAPVTSGGSPYEVVTTYAEAELPYLKFAQVGDVLYIAHGAHVLAELRRTSDAVWALLPTDFTHPEAFFGGNGEPQLLATVSIGDATHPPREWIYMVTTIAQNKTTGEVFESAPYRVTTDTNGAPLPSIIAIYKDIAVTVQWLTGAGLGSQPPGWSDAAILGHRVYRGRGSLFGLVGETTGRKFVDVGDAPDYTVQPPTSRNPFEVYQVNDATLTPPSKTLVRTENPSCVGFFEQRLALARTDFRPEWVWLSRTDDYLDFDDKQPGTRVTSDSVEFALASYRREEVRSIFGHDQLYLFTSAGVWTMSDIGADLVPIAKRQTSEGASWVSPLVVGDSLLYVRNKGVGVNEISFQNERGKFVTGDLATFAPHLLETHTVADWAYAHDPYRIVYAVRSDGSLLTMTYHREQEVLAWARHDTDGQFENVVSVPEGTEDAVYVVVNRTIGGTTKRYIERFASRKVSAIEDAIFLDCAKTVTGVTGQTISGLAHLEGKAVTVLMDGAVAGPFTVTAGVIDTGVAAGAAKVQAGLAYVSQLETLDLVAAKAEIRGKFKLVRGVSFEVVASRGLLVGETFERLEPWRQRTVADSYAPPALYTGLASVSVLSGWNKAGRACLEQREPLPVAVHALTREVELGGE